MPELTDLTLYWEKTEMSFEDFKSFFKCFPNLVNLTLKLRGLTGFVEDAFVRYLESSLFTITANKLARFISVEKYFMTIT